jgi:hypothetical protein
VVLVDDAGSVTDPDAMIIGSTPGTGVHRRVFGSVEELARNLYAWFREADAAQLPVIYVERVPETGLGAAVMNRLRKATGGND